MPSAWPANTSRAPPCPTTNLHWQKTSKAASTTPNPPTSATSPPSAGHWLTPCAPPGGDIREHCRIRHIIRTEDGYTLHDDNGNTHHGATLILCTGAYSKPFIQQLGAGKIALDTERGYHLMLPHEHTRLRRPISSIDTASS